MFENFINNNNSFVYVKFGDGEYQVANNFSGGNCDGTKYTEKLGKKIIESFKTLSQYQNVYFGNPCVFEDFNQTYDYFNNLSSNKINFVDYHTFIFKSINEYLERCESLYKSIKNSKQQKIYVCNQYNYDLSKSLLNIDNHILIDPINWCENDYENIYNKVLSSVKDPNNVIILTSAGMGAKVLINDLFKKLNKSIIIDIGSAMDQVFGNRKTRDYHSNFSENDILRIRESLK